MNLISSLLVLALCSSVIAAIKSEDVQYKAGDVNLKGTVFRDDAAGQGNAPGVVVFPEWWGANDYAKRRGQMLAELGYVALVADMYGDGKMVTDAKEAGSLAGGVYGKPEVMLERARAAVEQLREQQGVDTERMAAIGYCMGGNIALNLAYAGEDLDAVVSFHGNLANRLGKEPENVKPAVLVLHGANDAMVKQEEINYFVELMKKTKANWEFVQYGGAMHSFTNPEADKHKELGTIGYNEQADKRSWETMKDHLAAAFDKGK